MNHKLESWLENDLAHLLSYHTMKPMRASTLLFTTKLWPGVCCPVVGRPKWLSFRCHSCFSDITFIVTWWRWWVLINSALCHKRLICELEWALTGAPCMIVQFGTVEVQRMYVVHTLLWLIHSLLSQVTHPRPQVTHSQEGNVCRSPVKVCIRKFYVDALWATVE